MAARKGAKAATATGGPPREPAPEGKPRVLSVAMAEDHYQALRRMAFEHEAKISELVRAAVAQYVAKYGPK